ncbi:Pro-neuropeptide Y [Frankliniella fusca]|uniref:Pro-neuropeptide Y n=1 Tax=Frankliniella fusca TaxID=407009 RepID=A0AAE1HE40_9NEOP|nr:Pro-neuropeptide Y [Frankliniella fusca]
MDGFFPFKYSQVDCWPILGCLDEESEPFIVAVYIGEDKPDNVNEFLEDLVIELRFLQQNGIEIFGIVYPFRVNVMHQLGQWSNNVFRTDQSFADRDRPNHHEGVSPLENLGTQMVSQFVLDGLHLLHEGVFKRWLDFVLGTKKTRIRRPGVVNAEVKRLMSETIITLAPYIPTDFNRRPRALRHRAKYRATEFRRLFLYDGLIVFQHLPRNVYKSYQLLHAASYILSSPELYSEMNDIANLIVQEFITHAARISKYKPLQQIANRDSERGLRLCEKQNDGEEVKLLERHDPFNEEVQGDQYYGVKSVKFTLRVNDKDCCFLTRDDDIAVLTNIVYTPAHEIVLIGRKFQLRDDFSDFPVPSSSLGIVTVSCLRERGEANGTLEMSKRSAFCCQLIKTARCVFLFFIVKHSNVYSVVIFTEGRLEDSVVVVPTSWLIREENKTYWPVFSSGKATQRLRLIKSLADPLTESWPTQKIKYCHSYKTWNQAQDAAKRQTQQEETVSIDCPQPGRGKMRNFKRTLFGESSSDDSGQEKSLNKGKKGNSKKPQLIRAPPPDITTSPNRDKIRALLATKKKSRSRMGQSRFTAAGNSLKKEEVARGSKSPIKPTSGNMESGHESDDLENFGVGSQHGSTDTDNQNQCSPESGESSQFISVNLDMRSPEHMESSTQQIDNAQTIKLALEDICLQSGLGSKTGSREHSSSGSVCKTGTGVRLSSGSDSKTGTGGHSSSGSGSMTNTEGHSSSAISIDFLFGGGQAANGQSLLPRNIFEADEFLLCQSKLVAAEEALQDPMLVADFIQPVVRDPQHHAHNVSRVTPSAVDICYRNGISVPDVGPRMTPLRCPCHTGGLSKEALSRSCLMPGNSLALVTDSAHTVICSKSVDRTPTLLACVIE